MNGEHEQASQSARDLISARRTEYEGPVTSSRLVFGGISIDLERPADPDRMLDDPTVQAWNRHDDYMPYWAYLWPGALLLANVVATEDWEAFSAGGQPPRALEIGCGIGLAGLVALRRGLHVCFSDYDPAALAYAARNAERNGFGRSSFSTRQLDWREPPEETYPVILGSDVLYERRLVPMVARLMAKLLADGGLGLIACPGRSSAESFAAAVSSLGLTCQTEPVSVPSDSGPPITGLVYRIRAASGSREQLNDRSTPREESDDPGRPDSG